MNEYCEKEQHTYHDTYSNVRNVTFNSDDCPYCEIDRLTAELANANNLADQMCNRVKQMETELAEAREIHGTICGECGSVMQLVRPGKHQCQYCEMKEYYSNQLRRYREALKRLRDCDWVISLPNRMDAVRDIAREALGDGDE